MAGKTPNLATAPITPAAVSVLLEGDAFVFRTTMGGAFYVSDQDQPNQSACTGDCAKTWRPVYAPADAKPLGDWTVITRSDSKQWAYKGRAIYTYAADVSGQTRGDGVDGHHLLTP
jgi:predicted lipoprotein with Yx(FWY)xxD motif